VEQVVQTRLETARGGHEAEGQMYQVRTSIVHHRGNQERSLRLRDKYIMLEPPLFIIEISRRGHEAEGQIYHVRTSILLNRYNRYSPG
jgi:hypothetical protein